MDLVVVLGVIAIVVVAVTAYVVFAPRNVRPQRVPVVPKVPGLNLKPLAEVPEAPPPPRPAVPPSSAPLFDLDLEPAVVSSPPEIRWSAQFDPRSVALDDTARLRLIGDLGVIAKEWCVPLLSAAYEQERRPGHRQAALTALAACRSRAAARTFRLALASDDPAEAAIAADGLADLEPPPQAKVRRTVERH
jgi:hypothetical protein